VASRSALAISEILLDEVVGGWVMRTMCGPGTRVALSAMRAEAATRRVEGNRALSLEAFEEVFNDIPTAPDERGRTPGMTRLPGQRWIGRGSGRAIQQTTVNCASICAFRSLAEQNATNLKLTLEAASLPSRGMLHPRPGRFEKAAAALHRALSAFEQLARISAETGQPCAVCDAASWSSTGATQRNPGHARPLWRCLTRTEK